MEKRFYLGVRKTAGAWSSGSVPVAVVAMSEDTLRLRLLEDCIARNPLGFIPMSDLEVIARAGEEFDLPGTLDGKSAKEYLESLGNEYALVVPMKDHTGKNGYVGELTYTELYKSEPCQFILLEALPDYKSKTA